MIAGTPSGGRKQLRLFLKFLWGHFNSYNFLRLDYPNVYLALSNRQSM